MLCINTPQNAHNINELQRNAIRLFCARWNTARELCLCLNLSCATTYPLLDVSSTIRAPALLLEQNNHTNTVKSSYIEASN